MPYATPPALNDQVLTDVGTRLFKMFGVHETDREQIERRWLRNLRQVRKIYDPEVLDTIPKDRSKAYPGLTQWVVRGTIARLMQMLFPQTEKNYGVRPSAMPDLSVDQLQQVLDQLVASKGGDPAQVVLQDEEIEKAILAFAKGKAERMELKIDDDLQEMDYVTLARKVVRSAVIYNVGIAKGPLHVKVKSRTWERNANTGRYEAKEIETLKPLFEFLPVWSYYPDMTAVSLDKQDDTFERHIMTRAQVEELGHRTDFLPERINKYLAEHATGNYRPRHWESSIKGEAKSATGSVASKETRKFEVLSFWGNVSGHELAAAGATVPEADLGKSFHANAWMIDNVVIKLKLAPLGEKVRHHHEFVFEDDDLSILGNGQCDVMRDSQFSLCEAVRAALDNMSVIGPMVEVDEDRLVSGQSVAITKHKTFRTENNGSNTNTPAVRNINVDSHLTEIAALVNMFMGFADKESGLPPPSLGDTSGGGSEALRTSRNASMFLGAAALPIRDTVRNFDAFTMSIIPALVAWNRKYAPNPSRDGDHDVIARGSTSLIAKEVLAQSLSDFRTTITPDELPHVKVRGLLMQRAKANDIPIDDILEDEEVANKKIAAQQQAQQAQLQGQMELVKAQVEKTLSEAFEKVAKAKASGAKVEVDVFTALMEALKSGDDSAVKREKNEIDAEKVAKGGANGGNK